MMVNETFSPKGCICPSGAEETCRRGDCGRKDWSLSRTSLLTSPEVGLAEAQLDIKELKEAVRKKDEEIASLRRALSEKPTYNRQAKAIAGTFYLIILKNGLCRELFEGLEEARSGSVPGPVRGYVQLRVYHDATVDAVTLPPDTKEDSL